MQPIRFLIILITCLISAAAAWPQIGPFEISSDDSTATLRLQFAGQLLTQYESRDAGASKNRTEKLFSEARRIRLTLAGNFPTRYLSFKLHLSTAPGSIELMDAYFDYRYRPNWQLRFGQYKIPFTRYRIQSFQRLTFADWAIVTKYFGAERQIGAAVHNGYEKPPRWGYVIGIFTGVNARAAHATGLARIYGEESLNPSDLADPGPQAEYHPEIVVHASYTSPGMSIQSDTDDKRGNLRLNASLSAAWDLDPVDYQDLFLRLAPELLLKYRGGSFSAIGYIGFVKMNSDGIVRSAMIGGLWQTSYRVNNSFELSSRYANVEFDGATINDALSRADATISDTTSTAQIRDQYKNAGKVVREEELTVGINLYWIGHSLKWQNDGGWLFHTRRDETRKDFIIRSQLQLTF